MDTDTSPLSALSALVSSGIQTLEAAYADRHLPFPSLDEPFHPGPLDDDPHLTETKHLIVAAAHQIIATVRSPMDTIQDYAPAMYMSAALGFVDETNIADVLKDANVEGLHVDDISANIDVDALKIARILRYLSTRHVFRELTSNVFANNRISSLLIKEHPLEILKTDTLKKYDGAPAAAFIGMLTDEGFKSAAHLTAHIREKDVDVESPFNLAFQTKNNLWKWHEEPGNEWRYRRFLATMKGLTDYVPLGTFITGFDWKFLSDDSIIVDVGGSVGGLTLTLATAFPHLKYMVQDIEPAIQDAEKFWEAKAPGLVIGGRVKLQVQDFFEPQVSRHADVYILRHVLHDWSDSASEKILKNLRDVAGPSTKVVVFERVISHACPDPMAPPPPPFPILPNYGLPVGGNHTMLDLMMLSIVNGQERTLAQFVELGARVGWKLDGVKTGMVSSLVFSVA